MKRGGIDPISMDRRPLSQILDDFIPYERWEMEREDEIQKLRICLGRTLHYLTGYVNRESEMDPTFHEKAKAQVLEGRAVLYNWEKK